VPNGRPIIFEGRKYGRARIWSVSFREGKKYQYCRGERKGV
tara:strand:+ start:323 stop:445 length:123 start_codon:yes stop_codon:yes gene_type:complete